MPKALKSCPKSNKSPNLVTLPRYFILNSAPADLNHFPRVIIFCAERYLSPFCHKLEEEEVGFEDAVDSLFVFARSVACPVTILYGPANFDKNNFFVSATI